MPQLLPPARRCPRHRRTRNALPGRAQKGKLASSPTLARRCRRLHRCRTQPLRRRPRKSSICASSRSLSGHRRQQKLGAISRRRHPLCCRQDLVAAGAGGAGLQRPEDRPRRARLPRHPDPGSCRATGSQLRPGAAAYRQQLRLPGRQPGGIAGRWARYPAGLRHAASERQIALAWRSCRALPQSFGPSLRDLAPGLRNAAWGPAPRRHGNIQLQPRHGADLLPEDRPA